MAEVERAKSFNDTARDIARRFFRHENGALIVILVAIIRVMAVITRGATLTRSNISNIWLQSLTRGIAAIGQGFVILSAGIDLSVGGVATLASLLGGDCNGLGSRISVPEV